ncbi:MAG TPA: branched-chain amino acid ABC transporter permease [Candidatus Deferrimicrobiaceae bacterium]|nr:branched-chain amino acid ABC transporter permease [Candidatus Deferrimicrobiaceae bacterium]
MRRAVPPLLGLALLLLPLLAIEPRAWLTLTVAGLAMGMLVFLVAAGLTLIFGLMDVLNFAHGALFSWGAYAGFSVALLVNGRWGWADSPSVLANAGLLLLAVAGAVVVSAALGIVLERVIVRPVYGQHLFQILITLGATIVLEELIRIAWGPNDQVMPVPVTFKGSWDVADLVVVLRFPIIAIALGAAVYAGMWWLLHRTRVGLIVRAGVENNEMVQVMGHDIHRYFTAVFAAGSALAGVGGLMWGMFNQSIRPAMGGEQLIFAFIVVIIGGLGSVTGSLIGALLVGLSYNYVAYLVPKAAIGVTMAIMVLVLLVRPTGLYGTGK